MSLPKAYSRVLVSQKKKKKSPHSHISFSYVSFERKVTDAMKISTIMLLLYIFLVKTFFFSRRKILILFFGKKKKHSEVK